MEIYIRQYMRTIRFLKPTQIYHQARHHLLPKKVAETPSLPFRGVEKLDFKQFIPAYKTYLGEGKFSFLNMESPKGAIDWKSFNRPYLWQYNLHYFHYLNQPGMDKATGLSLIRKWIKKNPPGKMSVGWEPYPTSLRIVNWIKFFCKSRSSVPEKAAKSLLLQCETLMMNVELRLMGNHLFENGKALWFAGVFLKQKEAVSMGRSIILKELKEQFLPDGGHFELSPMYHAIMLEGLLDLINLVRAGGENPENELAEVAGLALGWLREIVDQKGNIPLLNDSAFGIAPLFKDMSSYAERLGLREKKGWIPSYTTNGWEIKSLSGYEAISRGPARIIFDAANLGPNHLPGHAHCDMLSVLFDYGGKSILADTGVYEYQEGDKRDYSRRTRAHNTVVLDNRDQAELWKAFRMGRRGRPKNLTRGVGFISCSHTGFAPLSHRRNIILGKERFEIRDTVSGPGSHEFKSFYHFSPDVRIKKEGDFRFCVNECLHFQIQGAQVRWTESEYYPEFGKIVKRPSLELSGSFTKKGVFGLKCIFSS